MNFPDHPACPLLAQRKKTSLDAQHRRVQQEVAALVEDGVGELRLRVGVLAGGGGVPVQPQLALARSEDGLLLEEAVERLAFTFTFAFAFTCACACTSTFYIYIYIYVYIYRKKPERRETFTFTFAFTFAFASTSISTLT